MGIITTYKYWNDNEIDLLKKNYVSKNNPYLSILLNRTISSVENKAQSLHLIKSSKVISENSRRYLMNENYFSDIDMREKARILGLLWSDGSVNTQCAISLAMTDKDVIEQVKNEISPDRPIQIMDRTKENPSYKIAYKISFGSIEMYNDLLKYNIVPRKTYKNLTPIVPKQFIDGFIQGLFEGDGWITVDKRYNRPMIGICGGENTCKWFKSNLEDIGIKNTNIMKFKHTKYCYKSMIYGKDMSSKFANFIYSNAQHYMKRKYNRFKEYGLI